MGNNDKVAVYKSKAPYNFIGLEDFILIDAGYRKFSMHDDIMKIWSQGIFNMKLR